MQCSLACFWKEICIHCCIKTRFLQIKSSHWWTNTKFHSPEPLAKGLSFHAQINISPTVHSYSQAHKWKSHRLTVKTRTHRFICGNYSFYHHEITWEPINLWHISLCTTEPCRSKVRLHSFCCTKDRSKKRGLYCSLLSHELLRQPSLLVFWKSKCKSSQMCPEHRALLWLALLLAKILLMQVYWATTSLCWYWFMGWQMLEEVFVYIYAGWKEQQKCPKSSKDQTGVRVLRLFIASVFCLHL